MILQSLAQYYKDRLGVPDGYQKKEIPFIIVLDTQGRFVDLLDTRDTEGRIKRARVFLVPREVKRSGSKAWEKANLLWDTPAYVVGISHKESENAARKHESFKSRFAQTFHDPSLDPGIAAIHAFLTNGQFASLQAHSSWPDVLDTDGYITFKLEGDECIVSERDAVKDILQRLQVLNNDMVKGICLVSGEEDEVARLHNAIKGVRGTLSTGGNIVSFKLPAFESFGKAQGYNAPVGKRAEFAYITALNSLLDKDSRQKIQVGDATTIFWAEKAHQMEDWFADFFGEPPKGESTQDSAAIKALYEAPVTGAAGAVLLDDDTRFYVLGLAPNAARIAVRFWYQGSVGEVARNIKQHFDDLAIVHGPNQPTHLSLFRLLVSTAIQGKSENIQPNLAGEFMKTILAGIPYPNTLLSSAIRRCRAEREVPYPRAALIKAVLARQARFYRREEKEVGMALDKDYLNIGYRLGRLFAVLEKIQEEANPGINATIRDRFYGSASGTPITAFPHLMKLKNHHLSKLENKGRAVNFERSIGEIMAGIGDIPTHLSLQDQGRFAVGYYHQRQDFFTKKEQADMEGE
ncbi:MAG: type I-C CRISPR-associated protein Cas8c/Csd1 [Firmicutes bacterium]|nr:type I-C CRISPR-associated protein Cas8c/Csd1 [Bacillota bacterium]